MKTAARATERRPRRDKLWGVPAGGRARQGCPLGERASTPQKSFDPRGGGLK
jgi:hypothetical protein